MKTEKTPEQIDHALLELKRFIETALHSNWLAMLANSDGRHAAGVEHQKNTKLALRRIAELSAALEEVES